MSKPFVVAALLVAVSGAFGLAQQGPVSADIQPVFSRIADAAGEPLSAASDPAAEIYLLPSLESTQVTTPAAQPITLAEFTTVDGRAALACVEGGTQLDLELTGLVPDGIYTVWVVTFAEPGFDGTMDNRSGVGSFGPFEGDENAFTASPEGTAGVNMLVGAGPLSITLEGADGPHTIGECLLSDEYEVHVVGSYHIDGQTHGSSPGPAGTEAFHFGATFKEGQGMTAATE